MNSMELPLVLFTVFSQIAVGLSIVPVFRQWQSNNNRQTAVTGEVWLVSAGLLLFAVIASLFHLGHPLGGPRAILNLGTAWLSREILFVLLFGAGIVATYLAFMKDAGVKKILAVVTAIMGLLLLLSTGMVYTAPGFPALNNGIPVFYSLLTAAILGGAFSSFFTAEKYQSKIVALVWVSLLIGLVVNLIIPSFWLSGSAAMQQTAAAYFSSPLYWLQIVGEFGVGLLVIGITRSIPKWLPFLLLAGELIGRISMFYLTVHASSNIGGL